ncbi:hypothetical protein [Desulfovibrio piger]|uniref:hypothetical protein n=2 Tax=Desulfovibrio TaxID=872 RepID=UPI0012ECB347|nr:hypothetical protein [Desulfovibrio piger]
MLAKLCRICPNTDSWKRPTGNKKGLGDFAGTNGFGVEEWLSRKEWLLSGYKGLPGDWRYAHITALWTKNNAYAGQDMRVYLFTYDNGAWLVGYIDQAHLIDEDEAAWAVEQFRRKGWLNAMREDVKAIEGNVDILSDKTVRTSPLGYASMRFKPDSLHFLPEPQRLIMNNWRYTVAYGWNPAYLGEVFPPDMLPGQENSSAQELARFSEAIRVRRAICAKECSPRQAPIQNRLALQLATIYGPQGYQVLCEDNRVDISIRKDNYTSFLEIKPADSAREAIRLALGQLLEYAHYPKADKADNLVVVSDAEPSPDDSQYIRQLRQRYGIPLCYVYWPRDAQTISQRELMKCVRAIKISG